MINTIQFKLEPNNFNYLGSRYNIKSIKDSNLQCEISLIAQSIDNFNNEIKWDKMFDINTAIERLKEGMKIYILVIDGESFGHVWFRDYEDGRFIFNLFVRNNVENKIYTGEEFVSDVIHRFEKNVPIYCEVDDWNINSIKLFKKLGFINLMKFWTPETIEFSQTYNLSNRINSKTNFSGLDNTGKCIYSFNEFGFRGDSIKKDGFKILSIGCSNTEGVGVNDEETWPSQFCDLIPNSVNMNFGYGGRSNDFMSRCLLTYFDIIKPDLVLIMYTETHRREYFTTDGNVEPFHVRGWGYFEENIEGIENHRYLVNLSNNIYDSQNWYKNHQLIKYFLKSKNCNWLWNGWHINNDYTDEFRFDGDYSTFIDMAVDNAHPGAKTNKKYAIDLYKHIIKNFPDYLTNK